MSNAASSTVVSVPVSRSNTPALVERETVVREDGTTFTRTTELSRTDVLNIQAAIAENRRNEIADHTPAPIPVTQQRRNYARMTTGGRRPRPTYPTRPDTPRFPTPPVYPTLRRQARNSAQYVLTMSDYRGRIVSEPMVHTLIDQLENEQYMIDRVNQISALETDLLLMREEMQRKTDTLERTFNELNTNRFRGLAREIFISLSPVVGRVGHAHEYRPYYPVSSRYAAATEENFAILRENTNSPPPTTQRGVRSRSQRPPPIHRTPGSSYTSRPTTQATCYRCGSATHWLVQCPQYTCRICGRRQPEHRTDNCPRRHTVVSEPSTGSNDDNQYYDFDDEAMANMTGEPYH